MNGGLQEMDKNKLTGGVYIVWSSEHFFDVIYSYCIIDDYYYKAFKSYEQVKRVKQDIPG